jgi:hypothetical protein
MLGLELRIIVLSIDIWDENLSEVRVRVRDKV